MASSTEVPMCDMCGDKPAIWIVRAGLLRVCAGCKIHVKYPSYVPKT